MKYNPMKKFIILGISIIFPTIGSFAEEFITGIDSDKLFKEVLPSYNKDKVEIATNGIIHSLEEPINKNRIKIVLAVYEDDLLAKQAVGKESLMISISPALIDNPFGDELYCWGSKFRGGTILLRRKNVVVNLSTSDIELNTLLELSRKIDTIIQTSSDITAKGGKVLTPKIKTVPFPASVPVSSKQVFNIEMEEESKGAEILIGADATNVVWKGGNKITYHALTKEGEDTFELVIATKNNVISKIKVKVKSIKQDDKLQ